MSSPFFNSEGRLTLKDLPLTPQETRASTHLDGARTIEHLLKSFPQDGDNLLRLVFLFRELELLAFRDGRSPSGPSAAPSDSTRAPREPPPPPSAPSPSGSSGVQPEASDAPSEPMAPPPEPIRPPQEPVRAAQPARPVATEVIRTAKAEPSRPPPVLNPAKTPPPTRSSPAAPGNPPPKVGPPKAPEAPRAEPTPASAQAELAELRARASRLKEDNYFQLLKVSEKADAREIKLAYLKLAKSYHPDTLSLNTSPEVGKLKAEIFTAIGEAYRVLSDDNSRANYLEIIKSGGNEELLPLAQVLLAEETFQRGSNLVKAKRFGEAVKVLDEAIKGNPDEGEFYAWRGYAKFFSIEDKRDAQAQAQKDLQVAVQKNPKCAPAYYFLGHIAKLGGDKQVALKHFRRAVEIKPDYIDAKREVRMLTTKK
jgi:curved DNA-binding protein CbpA